MKRQTTPTRILWIALLALGAFLLANPALAENEIPRGDPADWPCPDPPPKCMDRDATMCGTDQGETIYGTDQQDVIWAGGGNDTVYGNDGIDTICGHDGDDTLYGGAGGDFLRGNRHEPNGGDDCFGEKGKDEYHTCEGGVQG